MASHRKTDLVVDAVTMTVNRRGGNVPGVIHHGDRGAEYTPQKLDRELRRHGALASMGSVADCLDNRSLGRARHLHAACTIGESQPLQLRLASDLDGDRRRTETLYSAKEFPPLTSIGIMSMQRIRNYGSSLQGYALKRLLLDVAEGAIVSFVDYRRGEVLVKNQPRAWPLTRTLAKINEYNSVDASLVDRARFLNHKRTYETRYLPILGIPAQPNYDQDVDVLVIGSDEVFNCVQANTNVGYARDLFGHQSPARKIVSYAASFGNTTLTRIDEFGIREHLKEDFSRFAAISVRDRNSADIIEALIGERPVINVDPALAFDYMRRESQIPSRRQYPDKYILVYGYSGRLNQSENAALKHYARGIGAKILCIGGVQGCCDLFVDCSPFELLAYFRDAEAVVTDTFHGTIFSMINATPFGTIVRESAEHGYGNEEKLGFLLKTSGLESRRVADLDGIGDLLSRPIDAEAVAEMLTQERINTHEYLKSAVAGGGAPVDG